MILTTTREPTAHSSGATSETPFLGFRPLLLSHESEIDPRSACISPSTGKHWSDSVLQQEALEHKLPEGALPTSQRESARKPGHPPVGRPWNIANGFSVSRRIRTRFPLAASSYSDDGERLTSVDDLVTQNQAIPLQSLECYNVTSAQGIVCKAVCHHESTAVLEASDSEDGPGAEVTMDLTPANTIDDIVSRYAEPSPHSKTQHVDSQTSTRNNNSESVDDKVLFSLSKKSSPSPKPESLQHPIDALTLPPSNDSADTAVSTQAGSQMSSIVVSERPSDESDDRWTRSPRSSRCGFLTPSKMRFRLTSRASRDIPRSTLVDNCSPASPWGPLASPVHPRHHQRLETTRHQSYKEEDPAPYKLNSRHHRPSAEKSQAPKIVDTLWTEMSVVNSKSRPMRNFSSHVRCSPSHESSQSERLSAPQPRTLISSQPGGSTSTTSGPPLNHHVLPSSSLLPRDHLRYARVQQNSTLSGSHSLSRPSSTSIIFAGGKDLNGSRLEPTHAQDFPDKSRRKHRCSTDNLEGGPEVPQSEGAPITDTGTFLHRFHSSSHLADWLADEQYRNADREVSRYLRRSRLNYANPGNTDSGSKHCEPGSGIGFKMTGSSLADYSSESTPDMKSSQVMESKHSDAKGHEPGHDVRVIKRMSYSGIISDPSINVHGQSLSSLSGAHTERVHTVAYTNTSASLLSRRASFKNATVQVSYGLYQCPSFPLSEEQLALRVGEMENVPFERLQRLKNGEFLEKAWCFVHKRSEFSHARIVNRTVFQDTERTSDQRRAARLLIVLSAMTYFVGGFVLVDSMSRGGSMSQCAMAEVVRWLSKEETGSDGHLRVLVHPADARLAQRVVKVARGILVGVLLIMLGVFIWAAVDS